MIPIMTWPIFKICLRYRLPYVTLQGIKLVVYRSETPPEMVKVCSSDLLECLVKLFTCVWDSRSISQDWKDVLLIPLPRKEDLSLCDNWHGITSGW